MPMNMAKDWLAINYSCSRFTELLTHCFCSLLIFPKSTPYFSGSTMQNSSNSSIHFRGIHAILPSFSWLAVSFCRKYLQVNLFPMEFYTKRLFLSFLGYKETIAGFSLRSVLRHQDAHYNSLLTMVQGDAQCHSHTTLLMLVREF